MTAVAFAPLPSRALVAIGGEDWRSFLQGLLTQDVETLQAGEARFGALLTPQGRLMFDLMLVGREDGCWLEAAAERRDELIRRLSMYRLRAKVTIRADGAPVSALWGDVGEASGFIRDPRLPQLGWRGYGAVSPTGATLADEAAYEAHRLAVGAPGPADWVADTYPIEADFDLLGGIDFQKGCFVGQETTSRMKRRGQIKNRMLPIVFQGQAPAPGSEVLAGELRAGEVRSVGDGRAMALLRLDRIAGPLTAGGQAVQVDPPEWIMLHLPRPAVEGDRAP